MLPFEPSSNFVVLMIGNSRVESRRRTRHLQPSSLPRVGPSSSSSRSSSSSNGGGVSRVSRSRSSSGSSSSGNGSSSRSRSWE